MHTTVSMDERAVHAKLDTLAPVLPAPVQRVWFAQAPVVTQTGSFTVLTMVLNCAIAAEGHPAPLLFMQVTNVPTTSHT